MHRTPAGKLRTIVYVDGFNLYYGCLRDTPERWLDIGALCERLLNQDSEIVGIKYFTAKVKGRPANPHVAQRQQTYLRVLATVPNLTIHLGHFMTKTAVRRLLIDGFRARYDLAVVISNDSDLKEPIRFVREDLKAPVGVLKSAWQSQLRSLTKDVATRIFLQADQKSRSARKSVPAAGS